MLSMDSLGINTGIIVAIVMLSEVVKSFDRTKKFKRLYTLIPLLFSIVFALITVKTITVSGVIYKSLIFFGASSFSYNFIRKSIGEPNSWSVTKKINPTRDLDNDKG